ncbi:MAG TPA: hypothetical protein VFH01_05105 [Pyrinomonadaceae bacterium]|nr:hypothetical protein [Pyrinomonadaceae bacterium]
MNGIEKSSKTDKRITQIAPEARQKVASGKRLARRPWITVNNMTRPERA